MSQTISLQVPNHLNELATVLNWFEQLPHSSVPNQVWLRCQTALAEMFTNVVRHAHQNLPITTPVDLDITLGEHFLEIKVFDCGAGFDLSNRLSDLDNVDINAFGGRGLLLIHKIADIFTYETMPDGRNCMRIVKYFTPTNSNL